MRGGPCPTLWLEELLERGQDYDRVCVVWIRADA
jgi:hypothetical protein